jgi:hypothetical protein
MLSGRVASDGAGVSIDAGDGAVTRFAAVSTCAEAEAGTHANAARQIAVEHAKREILFIVFLLLSKRYFYF